MKNVTSDTLSQEQSAWRDGICIGDVVDGKLLSTNTWEMVVVDNVSPTKTEIFITFSDGIHNHISKPLMYSILLSSNNTIMGRKYWRLSNGLEFNLIYKIK